MQIAALDEKEWISALKLSTMCGFIEIDKFAIEVAIKMDLTIRVLLTRQHQVPALEGVVSFEEAKQLGWDVATRMTSGKPKFA